MKSLICLILAMTVSNTIAVLSQERPSVFNPSLDKLHLALTAKEPGWKITKKELEGNRATYRWEMEEVGKAEIHIFTTGSVKEAAVALQARMDRVQVGPTAKLDGLGDEAYVWKDSNRDTGIIRFRKGNLLIEVNASKSAIAQKFSDYAAKALPEK